MRHTYCSVTIETTQRITVTDITILEYSVVSDVIVVELVLYVYQFIFKNMPIMLLVTVVYCYCDVKVASVIHKESCFKFSTNL